MDMHDKFWMWGYTLEQAGERIPFATSFPSFCSLENAAAYFGFPNAVFMNSMHSLDDLEKRLGYLKDSRQVICALPHGTDAVLEGAKRIHDLAGYFPNITGVVLDDFLQLSGHETTPELVGEIKRILCADGRNLELNVVMYSDMNHLDLTPYLKFIDGIILWRWISTADFWRNEFGTLLHKMKVTTGKKIFHGIYLQNYGEGGDETLPVDMDLWKLMCMRCLRELQGGKHLDGVVLLQNAHVGNPRYLEQCLWLKQVMDWFFAVNVDR